LTPPLNPRFSPPFSPPLWGGAPPFWTRFKKTQSGGFILLPAQYASGCTAAPTSKAPVPSFFPAPTHSRLLDSPPPPFVPPGGFHIFSRTLTCSLLAPPIVGHQPPPVSPPTLPPPHVFSVSFVFFFCVRPPVLLSPFLLPAFCHPPHVSPCQARNICS